MFINGRRFVWLALLLLVWSLPLATAVAREEGLRVVVDIKPLHSILAGLMQGADAPELLIPDGQSPYGFVPDEAQYRTMADADLLFWVGPELEPGLVKPVASLDSRVRIIEFLSNENIKILPSRGRPGARDPYFWLDNRNVMILLDDITRLLQDADPKRAHIYERNRHQVLSRLARIDREYEYGYRGLKAGLGVQYHDTLQYFEQAYALKILDHVSETPGTPVDAASLLRVRERLVAGEAVCLLSERGLPADNLSLLLQGTRANQGTLNSLGVGIAPGPDLYFEMMDYNTDAIKRCLNADMLAAETARKSAIEDDAPVVDGLGAGDFFLTDHLGRLVSKETMRGKYQILYFGYTYCPDICPTSLQVLSQALHLLGGQADRFQPYFITIDPERDTVAVMRNYVQYYDDRLIGLTGSPEMVDRIAKLYKARYEKVVEDNQDPSLYLMDHTASLYLLDPEGRFITKFAHGISPEDLARELSSHLP